MDCYNGSNPTVVNCVITGNVADYGAGIHCEIASPNVVSCTITGNTGALEGGGVYCKDNSEPILYNCILWGNSLGEVEGDLTSSPTLLSCDIQGGWGGLGLNNISGDPLFVDAAGGNYRLRPGSPCIDAGTSNGGPLFWDMDGRPRYDDPMTANTGGGLLRYYDIGAHEFKGYYVNGNPAVGNDAYDGLEPVFNAVSGHGPELTIEAGIKDAADGDVVSVAAWTYTGAGNTGLDFSGKGIALLAQGSAANTIIDCQDFGRGFIFHSGETAAAVVDGFTITNGGGVIWGGAVSCISRGQQPDDRQLRYHR
jgi:hypothetical protein